jgi:hypothetical protein
MFINIHEYLISTILWYCGNMVLCFYSTMVYGTILWYSVTILLWYGVL